MNKDKKNINLIWATVVTFINYSLPIKNDFDSHVMSAKDNLEIFPSLIYYFNFAQDILCFLASKGSFWREKYYRILFVKEETKLHV